MIEKKVITTNMEGVRDVTGNVVESERRDKHQ